MAELDQRWHDLGEFIREQRRVGQLSLRKLSEKAGISNPYLSQIERGLRKPSAEILQNIAKALSISAETLYVQAGILDPPDGELDLIGSIRRDPDLDEEHKKTLILVYESFRAERRAALAAEASSSAASGDADLDPMGADDADPVVPVPDDSGGEGPGESAEAIAAGGVDPVDR